MALEVIECEDLQYPWDGEFNGKGFWALLSDENGKKFEFKVVYGCSLHEYENIRGRIEAEVVIYVRVDIDRRTVYEDYYDADRWSKSWEKVEEELRQNFKDIIDAIDEQCGGFELLTDDIYVPSLDDDDYGD
jgi:hypothetical protein